MKAKSADVEIHYDGPDDCVDRLLHLRHLRRPLRDRVSAALEPSIDEVIEVQRHVAPKILTLLTLDKRTPV